MTTLVVPAIEDDPWPTLGPQVADFMEAFLVYGPGDLRAQPYKVSPDFRAWLYRAYEVYPAEHPRAGKRRFKRVAISERKGTAKTEKAAEIAACEVHPDAPVRCDGFDAAGQPVGRGVRDPYIPLVAYTQDQTEELAFGALYVILSESALADDFDIGLERIVVLDDRGRAAGKVVPLAGSPNARDGARTTFQHFDETHRLSLENLRKAHRTMLANIPKRPMADPWSLETTTAFTPGENSVAESTMDYAREIAAGKVRDPLLFFLHRQAGDGHDLATYEGRRAAVIEASGPVAEWSDIDSIVAQWEEPDSDPQYLERVWCNRPRQASSQAFDVDHWKTLASDYEIPWRSHVTLGFDGSKFHDTTALVVTCVETGYQELIGFWERPDNAPDDWEVPEAEVDEIVVDAFRKWKVLRFYADPPYWETQVDAWAGRYPKVAKWWTNRHKQMAYALKAYANAMKSGELTHDGDLRFADHVGNAQRQNLNMMDEGKPLWVVRKERSDSPNKIDAVVAGCLSWEARRDSVAAGENRKATTAGFR